PRNCPSYSHAASEKRKSVARVVQTGPPAPSDADCSDRARSATEAFLFRRLETLAETAGRFRLNAELPIPFDGWGRMEVDLLCEPSHIAIELDGRQHLGDVRRRCATARKAGRLPCGPSHRSRPALRDAARRRRA